jgi:hypothetical protein
MSPTEEFQGRHEDNQVNTSEQVEKNKKAERKRIGQKPRTVTCYQVRKTQIVTKSTSFIFQ